MGKTDISESSGCGGQVKGCFVIALAIMGILVWLIMFAPKKEPKSIEQIQAENLRRKVEKDIQNEEAQKQRAIQEALERIRQTR